MRRKQALSEMEHDPLLNFGAQLAGEPLQSEEFNQFGEKMIKIKPKVEPTPIVEWWDEFFLPEGKKSFDFTQPDVFYLDRVTNFIQHPVPLKNQLVEITKQMTVPFYLTEKEKKKLKRKKRIEKEKEKQEKVSLGLMPAPLPRVTLKNYMKVMAKEAIQDPS